MCISYTNKSFIDITSSLRDKKVWNETTALSFTSPICHYFSDFLISPFFTEEFLYVLSIRSTFFLTGPFLSHFVPQNFYSWGIECFFSTNKTPVYTCHLVSQIPYRSCKICCRLHVFGFSLPPRTACMWCGLSCPSAIKYEITI
jgi:hypothetical protein